MQELSGLGEAVKNVSQIENVLAPWMDISERANLLGDAVKELSLAQQIATLSSAGLNEENIRLALSTIGVTDAQIDEAVTNGAVSFSQKTTTATTISLSNAYKGLAASIGVSTTALTAFIGVAVGLVALAIHIGKVHVSLEEAMESLEDSVTAFKETTEEIKNLNKELATTESRIKELQKLSDAGTISIADETELETLKEQNKELARQVALKQKQQITEGKQVLKDAQTVSSKTVRSQYDFSGSNRRNVTVLGREVFAEEEMQIAIDKYNELKKELAEDDLTEGHRKTLEADLDYAESRVDEMYNILEDERQAYLELNNEGYKLSSEDKERLKYLNSFNDVYLLWNHSLTQTKESFEALNAEQKRTILLNKFLDKNIGEEYAKSIVDAISDSDLDEYWDKDFSFIPPQMTDYETAEEYGKAYAKAWLDGIKKETEKRNADLLSITNTVDNINNKLKPALDSLAGIYTTLFDKDGEYEWKIIDVEEFASIKSELDSLSKDFGVNVPTENYENFVKILSNTSTTSEQAQQAFNDLATSIINNSNVVELTDENFNVLKNSLENLGITNVADILEYKLRIETEKLENEEKALSSATADSTEKIYEQSKAFIEQADMTDLAKSELLELVAQETVFSNTNLNMESKIEKLAALASAYMGVSDAVEYLNSQTNANVSGMGQDSRYSVSLEQAWENLRNKYFDDFEYEVEFKYDGNTTGDNKNKSSDDSKETFDWVETALSRIKRTITNLGKIVSATYRNWSTRNNNLAQEMSAVNKEIALQQQAYDKYIAKANGVGLPEPYKTLVEEGGLNITELDGENDKELIEQIKLYQEWYDKALDCKDAIEDLRANLAELAKTKFDNISAQYDEQTSLIEHNISMLDGFVSQAETAGYLASEAYYTAMSEEQKKNIESLQSEYSSLRSAFDEAVASGSIEKYSSDWYEMYQNVNDVEEELQSATTKLIEFNQTLQQLGWDVFDRIQDSIGNINSEADFLIELLNSKDLYDENGSLTNEGLSTQGLHAIKYNTYMEQSAKYAEEIADIEKEIANDPYDLELIDRRNELVGLQQDAVKNALAERDAIKDLVSNGYNAMLDSLNELIAKKKEALQSEKDLYDYQNQISEKTDTISSYKKQLQAYSSDNSEEAKATIQKLQVSLDDALKDLEQTEYEKYLSDQEKLLDDLSDQTQEWINTRLDDIDGRISEAINATNENAETISETLRETTESLGIKLSNEMVNIFGENSVLTSVNRVLNNIDTNMQNMLVELKRQAQSNIETAKNGQNAIASQSTSSTATPIVSTAISTSTSTSNVSTNSSSNNTNSASNKTGKYKAYVDGSLVGVYNTYGEAQVAANAEVNKRADKEANLAANNSNSPNATQIYNTVYNGVGSQLSKKIKIEEYATGTSNARRGINLVAEKGREIIVDNDGNITLADGMQLYPFKGGETVFNAKDTSAILNSSLVPLGVNGLNKFSHNISGITKNAGNEINQDIHVNFSLPNVTDANSLINELQRDKRFEKIVQSMTIDRALNKNSLSKNKY